MKKSPSKHKTARPAKGKHAGPANSPIRQKEDVQRSNDEHIDQDYPGFPHHPSNSKTISNGSAGAFEATEHTRDDEDSDEDNDDLAMGH